MFSSVPELDAPLLLQLIGSEAKNLKIIDVREHTEVASGAIPGAIQIPLATLPARVHELDKNDDLVIVCRSGARSAQACRFLAGKGFKNAYNLRGGMMAWHSHGYDAEVPVVAFA